MNFRKIGGYNLLMTKGYLIILTAMAVVLSLCSCAGRPPEDDLVYLTDDAGVTLLPSDVMRGRVDELQRISVDWGGNVFTMNALVIIDSGGLYLLSFGDMGQEIVEISYIDGALSFQSAAGVAHFDPQYIVMDMQLVFYPAAVLAPHLQKAGFYLDEVGHEKNGRRRLYRRGLTVMEITYLPGEIRIDNKVRDYTYSILREGTDG